MEKRGQLVNKALIVIIASAIVIMAFISAGKAYGSQEAFYKLAVARDLAITIDLMYSLPGNIEYVYPNDVSGYDIEVSDFSVKVYKHKTGKLDPTIAKHSFVGTDYDNLNAEIKGKRFVKLEKAERNIKITGVDNAG